MKFWKHSLIAATTFVALSSAVMYTSCTQDSCETLKCRNDGVCSDGFCRCPDGFEGTQCEVVAREKFLGTYAGITKVNQEQVFIDSAYIGASQTNGISIDVSIHSRRPEFFTGTVIHNDVNVMQEGNKVITMKWIGDNKIEILIDETVDNKHVITNFSGTKK